MSPKAQAYRNDKQEIIKILKSITDPILEKSQDFSEVFENLPGELTKWLQSDDRLAVKCRAINSKFPWFFRGVIYDLVPKLWKLNNYFFFSVKENGKVEFLKTTNFKTEYLK